MFVQDIADSSKPDSVMESTTDAAEWKLEVERVLPLLKVHIRTDNKVGIMINGFYTFCLCGFDYVYSRWS